MYVCVRWPDNSPLDKYPPDNYPTDNSPLDEYPPDNSHPDNSHPGQFPPRTIPTQIIPTPDSSHPGKLPPWTIPNPDDSPPDNYPPDNWPTDNCQSGAPNWDDFITLHVVTNKNCACVKTVRKNWGGNCQGWEFSGVGMLRGAIVVVGNFPGGNCLGGNCQGWELSGLGIVWGGIVWGGSKLSQLDNTKYIVHQQPSKSNPPGHPLSHTPLIIFEIVQVLIIMN